MQFNLLQQGTFALPSAACQRCSGVHRSLGQTPCPCPSGGMPSCWWSQLQRHPNLCQVRFLVAAHTSTSEQQKFPGRFLPRFPGYSFPLPVLPTLPPVPFPTHSQAVGMSPPGLQPPTFGSGCGFGPVSALAPHLPPCRLLLLCPQPAGNASHQGRSFFTFSSNGNRSSCYC